MYTYEESSSRLHSSQETHKKSLDSSFLHSESASAFEKDQELHLRPGSSGIFAVFPRPNEDISQFPFEFSEEDLSVHQRTCTTIINDVAQSYTFVPELSKTQESGNNEYLPYESLENSLKHSIMASTADPKSFLKKSMANKLRKSTILTVSSNSSSNTFCQFHGSTELNIGKPLEKRTPMFAPIFAYCQTCKANKMTEVIENRFGGTL